MSVVVVVWQVFAPKDLREQTALMNFLVVVAAATVANPLEQI